MNGTGSGYFPLYVDLTGKEILVVGAGNIARRRIFSLLPFGCSISVIAPEAASEVKELAEQGKIVWQQRAFRDEDIVGRDMVLAASGDKSVNDRIVSLCRENGICVNHAGDQTKCDFYFPGLIRHEDMVIGFCSGGKDHGKVRRTREKIQAFLETGDPGAGQNNLIHGGYRERKTDAGLE